MFLKNQPLKIKLISLIMSIAAFSVFALSGTFIASNALNIRQNLLDKLAITAEFIDLRVNYKNDLRSISKDIFADKEWLNIACVFDKNNHLIFNYYKHKSGVDCGEVNNKIEDHNIFINVTLKKTLYLNNNIAGYVYLVANNFDLYQEFYKSLFIIFTIGIMVLVLVWFFTNNLVKIITKPILNLVDVTGDVVKNNNFSLRVKKFYNDEIGELSDAFNNILTRVEDSNKILERQVTSCTIELEKEKVRAEASSRAKSEFLRNMSHELRTPLHAMNSFSIYGLQESFTADRKDLHKYFLRIQASTLRLLKLMENILTLARLETNQEIFNIDSHNIIATIKAAIEENAQLMTDKNINVNLTPPNFVAVLNYDNNKMLQVFSNILGNAIKFSANDTNVEIYFMMDKIEKSGAEERVIKIFFADQGVGLPNLEKDKVFEKFVQSSRTNNGAGGTGLGLAIVKNIIENHGGKIEIKDNEQNGSIFIITLPVGLALGRKL